MRNGFILPVFKLMVRVLFYLNPAEWVKFIGAKIHGVDAVEGNITGRDIAIYNHYIDIFVILKWSYLVIAIWYGFDGFASKFIISYLIVFNAFGYFYYHGWRSGFLQRQDIESQRRRFLSLLQAIGFYLVSYAYLFQQHYVLCIVWPDASPPSFGDAFYLSVANAFTLTYPGFEPVGRTVRLLFLTELANTFLFFTVLIGSALPDGPSGPRNGGPGNEGASK